jgi:hypothetical protein
MIIEPMNIPYKKYLLRISFLDGVIRKAIRKPDARNTMEYLARNPRAKLADRYIQYLGS